MAVQKTKGTFIMIIYSWSDPVFWIFIVLPASIGALVFLGTIIFFIGKYIVYLASLLF